MQSCDVLIVGGGPAGSSCAWRLTQAGLDVLLLDRRSFPRDKVCGGWITPQVLQELQLDPVAYGADRVLQPITGFRAGLMGAAPVQTNYSAPVSYGLRRFEFDHFLLERSAARLCLGTGVQGLRRAGQEWIINEEIRAPLVVGAGGHFCPVARLLGARLQGEGVVAAQEMEFPLNPQQQEACSIDPAIPELYFCPDLKGYGWGFRKQNFLNLGLGRLGNQGLSRHVATFFDFLKAEGKIPADIPPRLHGHAYLLRGYTPRNLIGEGMLLVGDAAGLAYSQSGEGIRPAIESGLLAAKAILEAGGRYSRENLESYRTLMDGRFGRPRKHWTVNVARCIPERILASVGGALLGAPWFSKHVLLERWFLHLHQPALSIG
ncbi:MAG: NAD(P)/FAD-dependent oxidoreductase [Acidobacteria bacterium]|nr:NAD(P)/FAD-dependent oxidoreductase [Acidobacteriota bacterium]